MPLISWVRHKHIRHGKEDGRAAICLGNAKRHEVASMDRIVNADKNYDKLRVPHINRVYFV